MVKNLFLIFVFWLFFLNGLHVTAASEPVSDDSEKKRQRFELDEIVVTGIGTDSEIWDVPKNITVITADDIAQAPSNNLVDLLAREVNLNLRSSFGSDKKAGIDIRGMGDTYVSNVLVTVNGIRWNSPDLAGPDFSSMALDNVERIEIIRGSGCVLYGDGAVGGVINIITKKGKKEPELRIYNSYGDYDTYDGRGFLGGTLGDLNYSINASYYGSNGYRDNGYLRKKDAGIRMEYAMNDFVRLMLDARLHDDDYGLPGAVSLKDIDSGKRRVDTAYPNDFGETRDNSIVGGIELDFQKFGILNFQAQYRDRENSFVLLSTEEEIMEDVCQGRLNYRLDMEADPVEYTLLMGFDYYDIDYLREEKKAKRKKSDVEIEDLFIQNEWELFHRVILNYGYRYSRYEGVFRYDTYKHYYTTPPPPPPIIPPEYLYSAWEAGEKEKETWTNNAFDLGLTCFLGPDTTLFVNYAKSYRNPNVDELVESDDDLHPQEGLHLDLGARHHFGDFVETSITFFQIEIDDEIYYGEIPSGGGSINRNYDEQTLRRGIELDFKCYPLDRLYVCGNYSYTKAKFRETHAYVPLVPKHQGSLGVEWRITRPLLFSTTATWVGSRYDGNDQSNTEWEKMDDYRVVDAKLSYEYKKLKVFLSVNNIFDEFYETAAYSESYYPMPTRNASVGIEWRF